MANRNNRIRRKLFETIDERRFHMNRLSIVVFVGAIAPLGFAQGIYDSFSYPAGTIVNNLASPAGFTWYSHNLNGNQSDKVLSTGLTYADAGLPAYTQFGGAVQVDAAGSNAPNLRPTTFPAASTRQTFRLSWVVRSSMARS